MALLARARRVVVVGYVAVGAAVAGARRALARRQPALLALLEAGRAGREVQRLLEAARPRGQLVLAVDVGEAAYLEALGDLEQRADLLLRHVYLTLVHELDRRLHLRPLDVLHYDDRVLAGIVEEERLEVGAARGEHHLVGLDRVPVAGQGHVDEALALQQLVEDVGQVRLVVVPAQAELLGRARAALLRHPAVVVGQLSGFDPGSADGDLLHLSPL